MDKASLARLAELEELALLGPGGREKKEGIR